MFFCESCEIWVKHLFGKTVANGCFCVSVIYISEIIKPEFLLIMLRQEIPVSTNFSFSGVVFISITKPNYGNELKMMRS